jgi:hypothetical protein
MHFEILIEDNSGKVALEGLVPRIIGDGHTYRIHAYKGIGRIPKNLRGTTDPQKRILLDRLPKILRAYGTTHASYPRNYPAAVIVICDLDDKCLKAFRQELLALLEACDPRPNTAFCIAVEEGEAWFLGDIPAIKKAYPKAKDAVLNAYINDSICGTWERLAEMLYPGGAQTLVANGWQAIGEQKSIWAIRIVPHMDIENNKSPSFCYFRQKLRKLASGS